ncbi:DUF1579 domain-containing protein [Sphingomonas sp. M1-B02]|uniref:DUF1579 domain-containing protein n=1 Tax=Sphingomonas sp. M1-B02 TaxID=3114300 RepID=UPI0022401CB8|nr:DUF1579 domain-containing protein [Sphingomonas sp. S6-11]UZK64844.1 DUF1579 domain-containing protein [Sphingomonas sp. S6-11]
MTRRYWLAAGALLLAPIAAQAQGMDHGAITAQQAAMAKIAPMRGIWRGPASTKTPQGEIRMTQTERVGPFLDGTLTLVEGKAYLEDGSVGFNAFATISYDVATKTYWMNSHAQGRSGRFELKLTGTGWTWDIPAGPAMIHYEARFEGGKWTEVGDRIAPGQPPQRFFEMTLTRIGDTDWPLAGGVTKN